MLSCIIGNKSINTFDYDKSKLKEWSNKGMLKCPECGEELIYCHGDFKIPYFKHKIKSDCVGSYCEENTEEHRNGIRIIYDWLKTLYKVKNIEVEKYIKETKQRPDIYFEINEFKYCIEFQCSPISSEYNRRRELYSFIGVKDIWILGINKYHIKNIISSIDDKSAFELRIKTIENEIDFGSSPLLYLNVETGNIIKNSKDGFSPVRRHTNKAEDLVLKKTFECSFKMVGIEEVDINFLLKKNNYTLSEIISKTHSAIEEIESLVFSFNKSNEEDKIKFTYDLSNDRFPIFHMRDSCSWRGKITYEYCDNIVEEFINFINNIEERKANKLLMLKEYELKREIERMIINNYKNRCYSISASSEIKDIIANSEDVINQHRKAYNIILEIIKPVCYTNYRANILIKFRDVKIHTINITNLSHVGIKTELDRFVQLHTNTVKLIKPYESIVKCIDYINNSIYDCDPLTIANNYINDNEEVLGIKFKFRNSSYFIRLTSTTVLINGGCHSINDYYSLEEMFRIVVSNNIRKARYSNYGL